MKKKKSWWWLSFVDPDLPQGERWLGVALIQGIDLDSAVRNAWALEANPGGEIMALEVPASVEVPEALTNRLLTEDDREAIEEAFGPLSGGPA